MLFWGQFLLKDSFTNYFKEQFKKKSNTSHFRWQFLGFLQHVLLCFDVGWFSPYLKQVRHEECILSIDFVLFILTVLEALEKFLVFHSRCSI